MNDVEIRVFESTKMTLGANNSMIPVVRVTVKDEENSFSYSFPILGGDVVRFPEKLSYPGSEYYDEIMSELKRENWTPYRVRRN